MGLLSLMSPYSGRCPASASFSSYATSSSASCSLLKFTRFHSSAVTIRTFRQLTRAWTSALFSFLSAAVLDFLVFCAASTFALNSLFYFSKAAIRAFSRRFSSG